MLCHVDLDKLLGKKTIAEFVENEAVFESFRALKVDYAQGDHFDSARPLDDIEWAKTSTIEGGERWQII